MSKFLFWIILSRITGSPLLSAVVLLLAWYFLDRFTLRVLPNPVKLVMRWLRASKLRRELLNNPHDRRNRLELGELLLERGRYAEAVETLRPNLEAGDEDSATLYAMGVSCLGAGHAAQGEKLLEHLLEQDRDFRLGQVHLELGRWRLQRGEFESARKALEEFCRIRKGTVEGRVLLARAMVGAGKDGEAALMREEAWNEYASAPRFRRRVERPWAWRARPSRPITYALIAVLTLGLFAKFGAPSLMDASRQYGSPGHYADSPDQDYESLAE
jgi:hypothetical protein